MAKTRNNRSAAFKAKVVLEAIRERKTVSEIAKQFSIHPTQIHQWKKRILDGLEELFEDGRTRKKPDESEVTNDQLFEQIGRLKMELEWVKKNLPSSLDARRSVIGQDDSGISVRRQCELLGVARSSAYYEAASESEENLLVMKLIDQQYLETPFYGSRRMVLVLQEQGHDVNRKRVQRLMQLMDLEAIYPKKRTSDPAKGHKKYPYLLRNLEVRYPNQVWCTDITYIPMKRGYMYLVAIMDWYSRHVMSWRLSNSLETSFCIEALEDALRCNCPKIFNSDQGAQFTANEFTERLHQRSIAISMDGRRRALDNAFIERLWRSLKYEGIYLKEYQRVDDLYQGISSYFEFYSNKRPHQGLNYRTPREVYESSIAT